MDDIPDFSAHAAEDRLSWRVEALEAAMKEVKATKPELMRYEINGLSREVRGLRRAIISAALGVVGALLIFAVTVFVSAGAPN